MLCCFKVTFGVHGCEGPPGVMSAMICAVVLLSPSVLMDVRVRLQWMFAMMCCRFAVTFGAHGCTWCREPVFEQAVSTTLYFCISVLCAMYMVSRARL